MSNENSNTTRRSNCSRMVDVNSLYCENNVRTTECERIPDMVASIKRHGFKNNHPLVVHEQPDGRMLVLCGNRRTLGLFWLRDNEPETFKELIPSGKIAAVVHKGLTAEEQIELRIDHSADEDRVPLDDWSLFLAIKQLVVAFGGESQSKIAEKLGLLHDKGKNVGKPNRSIVQPRVSLARLPKFVQSEFEKLCRNGRDATPIRWSDVKELYTVYNREFAEYPAGDGPDFRELWDKLLNPPTKENSDDKESSKSLSPADAKTRAQSAQSNIVRRVLLAATGQGSVDLPAIDAIATRAESAEATLDAIRQYLGDSDYNELVAKSTAAVAESVASAVVESEATATV